MIDLSSDKKKSLVYNAAMRYYKAILRKDAIYSPVLYNGPLPGITEQQIDEAWQDIDNAHDELIEACKS